MNMPTHETQKLSIKAKKIRIIRKLLILSPQQFAGKCGYEGSYIAKIEKGIYPVSIRVCQKICEAYDVSEEWLLNDNDRCGLELDKSCEFESKKDAEPEKTKNDESESKTLLSKDAEHIFCISRVSGRFSVVDEKIGEGTTQVTIIDEDSDYSDPHLVMEKQGKRLRSIFEKTGMTQRQFCAELGVSTRMLVPLMEGRKKITTKYAEKIENVFGVGADWLMFGIEEAKEYPCTKPMILWLKRHPEARKKIKEMMDSEV